MGETTEEDEVFAQLERESREADTRTGYSGISRGHLCYGIRDSNRLGYSTTLWNKAAPEGAVRHSFSKC